MGKSRDDRSAASAISTQHLPLEASLWFYRQRGKTYGPVSPVELRAAAHLGFLGHRDVVRCKGQSAWLVAGSLAWLATVWQDAGRR